MQLCRPRQFRGAWAVDEPGWAHTGEFTPNPKFRPYIDRKGGTLGGHGEMLSTNGRAGLLRALLEYVWLEWV